MCSKVGKLYLVQLIIIIILYLQDGQNIHEYTINKEDVQKGSFKCHQTLLVNL